MTTNEIQIQEAHEGVYKKLKEGGDEWYRRALAMAKAPQLSAAFERAMAEGAGSYINGEKMGPKPNAGRRSWEPPSIEPGDTVTIESVTVETVTIKKNKPAGEAKEPLTGLQLEIPIPEPAKLAAPVAAAVDHSRCGRGDAENGPDDSDCAHRGTALEAECAAAGCGFCIVAAGRRAVVACVAPLDAQETDAPRCAIGTKGCELIHTDGQIEQMRKARAVTEGRIRVTEERIREDARIIRHRPDFEQPVARRALGEVLPAVHEHAVAGAEGARGKGLSNPAGDPAARGTAPHEAPKPTGPRPKKRGG